MSLKTEESASPHVAAAFDSGECRFYENEFPEAEEVVMVNVTEISEMGANVQLLEYYDSRSSKLREGMILLTELSRRRIRSINKLVRVNRHEVVKVIRVDKEKNFIDLSKRQVEPEEQAKCEERYAKARNVHSILRQIAHTQRKPVETIYQTIGWPLYRKYGHALDAFKKVINPHSTEDIFEGLVVDEGVKEALLTYIRTKLAPTPIKIRADIEVTCFTYEGIDAIKEALALGEGLGDAEGDGGLSQIKLIAPPLYVITVMMLNKDEGVALLTRAIDAIVARISEKGGRLEVKMAPKAVTAKDETELEAMMQRLALEQQDQDGDDDAEN